MRNTTIISIVFIILAIGITGCAVQNGSQELKTNNNLTIGNTQDLKSFGSIDELKEFLSQQSASANNGNTRNSYLGGGAMMKATDSSATGVAGAMTENAAPVAVNSPDATHSETNVQVAGVDEADFIKNDDRYIYMIANNELVIIEGNGNDSKILSKTLIDTAAQDNYYGAPNIREIFLNKDKVIVFADVYERSFYFEKYDIKPIESSKQATKVYEFDVSDRTNPKITSNYTISGGYYDSRMINNIVYIITQENLYNWQYYDGPQVSYAKGLIRPTIYYFDNPEDNYQMNTITSINVDSDNVVDSKSLMLGYGDTVMVSENNIYIAYQKQNYRCWGWMCPQLQADNKKRFETVVVPLLEGDIKDKVTNIMSQGLSETEEWNQISAEFSKFYANIESDSKMQDRYQEMFGNIEDALNEYDAKIELENSKTIIHRIAINDGMIEYKAKGEVDGRLLNQFSMDENNNNLRVATNVNMWLNNDQIQYNNVYVLNSDMNIIGSLTNLARNESIYGTRFVGDKLYMVTFRQIDPFFVIDLSDATSPKVLGYLKIPGYSSYLHPISDKLILGVGKETGTNEWGGVTSKGVKITLFDVSDFNNPKEVDTYEIGLQGTDTPILYDHKAFLYSKAKGILVIPVTEITSQIKNGDYSYRTKIWNGAYVLNVTDEGFALAGKIKHSSSETEYYNWFNTATVTRSLYIGDYLYTISNQYVKVSDMNNSYDEVDSINVPSSEENYPVPIKYDQTVSGSAGIVAG